eukprot:4141236-Prymnesium_polylepis.1
MRSSDAPPYCSASTDDGASPRLAPGPHGDSRRSRDTRTARSIDTRECAHATGARTHAAIVSAHQQPGRRHVDPHAPHGPVGPRERLCHVERTQHTHRVDAVAAVEEEDAHKVGPRHADRAAGRAVRRSDEAGQRLDEEEGRRDQLERRASEGTAARAIGGEDMEDEPANSRGVRSQGRPQSTIAQLSVSPIDEYCEAEEPANVRAAHRQRERAAGRQPACSHGAEPVAGVHGGRTVRNILVDGDELGQQEDGRDDEHPRRREDGAAAGHRARSLAHGGGSMKVRGCRPARRAEPARGFKSAQHVELATRWPMADVVAKGGV